MENVRTAIEEDRFLEFRKDFYTKYYQKTGMPKEITNLD